MNESLKEIKFLEDLPDQVLIIDKFKSIGYANNCLLYTSDAADES